MASWLRWEVRTYRFLDEVDSLALESGRPSQGDIHVRGVARVDVRLEVPAWALGRLSGACKVCVINLPDVKYGLHVSLMKCRLWFIADLHDIFGDKLLSVQSTCVVCQCHQMYHIWYIQVSCVIFLNVYNVTMYSCVNRHYIFTWRENLKNSNS